MTENEAGPSFLDGQQVPRQAWQPRYATARSHFARKRSAGGGPDGAAPAVTAVELSSLKGRCRVNGVFGGF